jgi:uncharacterized protein (TIGR04255 family)
MMNSVSHPIPSAPIIEAIVDIDCDLPTNQDSVVDQATIEAKLGNRYPKFRQMMIQQHQITRNHPNPPEMKVDEMLGAMQFLTEDERQLIQFRPNGYSFNRLAPYVSFDDYLKEIEWSWNVFLELAKPVLVRKIGIRMINRIMLPLNGGQLNFSDFLKVSPQLPETGLPLSFLGFLDQQLAIDQSTGNHVNIIKTTEVLQGDKLPMILDIDVFFPCEMPPSDWSAIQNRLQSLRSLKNQIFWNTLTPQCQSLFSAQD